MTSQAPTGIGRSRRQMLAHAGSVASGALLVACGGSQAAKTQALPSVKFDQPVGVTFWHTQQGANAKALQDMVDTFNQTNNKRITVRAQAFVMAGHAQHHFEILKSRYGL